MERRKFIQAAGGAAAAAVATSASAESLPTLTWRMASSFPKSLDTLFGGAEFFAQRVAELTQGKFTIRAFPAGEIVPAFQVLDAVQNGTIEMGHTPLYIYFGKDPTFTFDTCGKFATWEAIKDLLISRERCLRSHTTVIYKWLNSRAVKNL